MKRILVCGMGCAFGGVEEYLMNVFRNIDKSRYIFDFIINDSNQVYCEEEIHEMGGEVYYLNTKNLYYKNKSMKELLNSLRENHDVIYFNTSSFYNIYAYECARKLKFKKIIVHAHNTKDTSRSVLLQVIHYINRIYINRIATVKLACSKKAAEWIFGKKKVDEVIVINNAIDINKFKFNENIREKIRKKMNLEDKFVIGHIGRFIYQKNHDFLIDVFNEVVKERSNAVLLLIGEGELKKSIEDKVKKYNLDDKVIFYGTTDKIYELYNVMDLFVLPSHYEGLPVVGVEAQVNGVNCIFSRNITDELNLNKNVEFISINDRTQWVKKINKLKYKKNRTEPSKEVVEKYSINNQISTIEKVLKLEEVKT